MPRNKCSGCRKVIAGSTATLSRHQNACPEYQRLYDAVPTGLEYSHANSSASSPGGAAGATSSTGVMSSARKLADRLRLNRQNKRSKRPSGNGSQSSIPLQDDGPTVSQDEPMQVDSLGPDTDEGIETGQPPPVEVDRTSTPAPESSRQTRPNRGKLPARYVQNIVPEGPAPLPEEDEIIPAVDPPPIPRRFLALGPRVRLRLTQTLRTAANKFGLSRVYYGRPTSVPDAFSPLEDILQDSAQENPVGTRPPSPASQDPVSQPRMTLEDAVAPYPNYSSYLFNSLHWDGEKKTKRGRKALQTALLDPLFSADDIAGVNFDALDEKLARGRSDTLGASFESSVESDPRFGWGWKRSSVHIQVPHGQKKTSPTLPTEERCRFTVPDIMHRSIPDVVCSAFAGPSGKRFHTTPFRESWTNPHTDKVENVYGEFYSSETFIRANDELQELPPEPGCSLPRAVAGIFMASDSAHLTDTGDAKIHPFNVIIPNQSKYDNGKPSTNSVHPVMYLPPMPDTLEDFVNEIPGSRRKAAGHPIFAHCRREYYHGALRLVFDDQFWEMYKHGRVVECADGVKRRLYLRLFVYSADYPEKALVATIRDGGKCPCPRCLVREEDLHKMGTPDDMGARETAQRVDDDARRAKVGRARKTILKDGGAVNNSRVEEELRSESYVPTENALSVTIEGVALDVFSLLVVDLLHEIELGVWVGLLAHLIRILHSLGGDQIRNLNSRFREIAPFGQDAIRSFRSNVAKMSRMTADGYANMLQCAIPCFEGLFPEPYDSEIQSLLFTLARWHSLAKLRLHTDSTLHQLDQITKDFGNAIRNFQNGTCKHFNTKETPEENAKRVRAMQAAIAAGRAQPGSTDSRPKAKTYSTSTYKYHAMGDYVSTITRVGTTDGYTTAINERSHRIPVSAFQRTSKHNFEAQIANIGSINEAHREIRSRLQKLRAQGGFPTPSAFASTSASAAPPVQQPPKNDDIVGNGRAHVIIAEDEGNPKSFSDLRRQYSIDPAYEDFTPDGLKDHILSQFLKRDKPFSTEEHDLLHILGSRVYEHARARFNYTTYDMKRGQDCVSWKTRKSHVMLLADDESEEPVSEDVASHPFLYARVIGIYHVKIQHPVFAVRPRRFNFLRVRWLHMPAENAGGWAKRRLDRVEYVPQPDPDAFGFLDPAKVLRGCHLVPAYAHGMTKELLGPSVTRDSQTDGDWKYFYVMRFSDRDLMMRYTGLGIGHKGNIPRRWIDFGEPTLDPIIEEPVVHASEPPVCESPAQDIQPEAQEAQQDRPQPTGDGDEESIHHDDADESARVEEDWSTWD